MKDLIEVALALGILWGLLKAYGERSKATLHQALEVLGVDCASVMVRGGGFGALSEELARTVPTKDLALRFRVGRAGFGHLLKIEAPTVKYTIDLHELVIFWQSLRGRAALQADLVREIRRHERALARVAPYFHHSPFVRIG